MRLLLGFVLMTLFHSCAGAGGGAGSVMGNEGGSTPINEEESYEYQRAVNRCHRTGGTRIVKIKGELRCY